MIHSGANDTREKVAVTQEPAEGAGVRGAQTVETPPGRSPEIATRARQRAKPQTRQNRFVLIGASSLVAALLAFVVTSVPRRDPPQKGKSAPPASASVAPSGDGAAPGDKSLFPITDSGRPAAKESHEGFLNEQDVQQTAAPHQRSVNQSDRGQASLPGSLGSIPPFGEQAWQAPPDQATEEANSGPNTRDSGKAEREALEKSSLVYVRSAVVPQGSSGGGLSPGSLEVDAGLGLAIGMRLRARLESAASTAVRTPVLAVIEYNYERDGEILIPAGAKAIGHLRDADRSGYARLEFDSLTMPDGEEVPIHAVATDLEMRPLRGRVEGKNPGKNVLVRSLSGIGELGAMLVGRGSLNQPLSESDLLRERVGNNIGEAGDALMSRTDLTKHIVVTIPADIPIYVVLEQAPKANLPWHQPGQYDAHASVEELRQLLQLQQELNQSAASKQGEPQKE
jgi:type IV secretory pathway VirB10-like protein